MQASFVCLLLQSADGFLRLSFFSTHLSVHELLLKDAILALQITFSLFELLDILLKFTDLILELSLSDLAMIKDMVSLFRGFQLDILIR